MSAMFDWLIVGAGFAGSVLAERIASQRGMRSLREDGARQVLAGRTSLEDVLAATQAGEMEA